MTPTQVTEFRTMLARLMHIGSGIDRDYSRSELLHYQATIEQWLGTKIGRPLDPKQVVEFRVMTGTLFGILSRIADGDKEKDDLISHQQIIEKWVDLQTGRVLTALVAPHVKMSVGRINGTKQKLK